MKVNDREYLWVQKYRPSRVDDCILPEKIKKVFKDFIASGEIPNFLLSGSAGTGKTTIAYALCAEIGADVLYINASLENGIDVLRTKIAQFASTVSFGEGIKVVILDEGDALNCLDENERIQLSDGSYIKLKDLDKSKKYLVKSLNLETGNIEDCHAEVVNSEFSDNMYEVEFSDGSIHLATGDHPFIIRKDGNFIEKKLLDITDEDDIVSIKNV